MTAVPKSRAGEKGPNFKTNVTRNAEDSAVIYSRSNFLSSFWASRRLGSLKRAWEEGRWAFRVWQRELA